MTEAARKLPWLADAEDRAMSWIIANQLPEYLAEVQPRRSAELAKARRLVVKRLEGERDRLLLDAAIAAEKERAGEKPKESAESLNRKAVELDIRLRKRLELLDQQALMSTKPPHIVTAALVLPVGMLEAELPASAPIHAKETKEVERRGVELVLARERELGRKPVEQAFNNKGFDILSTDSQGDTFRIEVKARIDGATDFFVTHNEVHDRQERRTALPPRPRQRRPPRTRSTTRSATSMTHSPRPTSVTSRPPASAATGPRCGTREGLPSDVRATAAPRTGSACRCSSAPELPAGPRSVATTWPPCE